MGHSLAQAARHPAPGRGGVAGGEAVCTCHAHRRMPAQWDWPEGNRLATRAGESVDGLPALARRLWLYGDRRYRGSVPQLP